MWTAFVGNFVPQAARTWKNHRYWAEAHGTWSLPLANRSTFTSASFSRTTPSFISADGSLIGEANMPLNPSRRGLCAPPSARSQEKLISTISVLMISGSPRRRRRDSSSTNADLIGDKRRSHHPDRALRLDCARIPCFDFAGQQGCLTEGMIWTLEALVSKANNEGIVRPLGFSYLVCHNALERGTARRDRPERARQPE